MSADVVTDAKALSRLQVYIGGVNQDHGFNDYADSMQDNPAALMREQGNDLLLVVSEIVEAHDEIRTGHAVNETYYLWPNGVHVTEEERIENAELGETPFKPEGVPSEVADAIIRLLHFAEKNHFDAGAIVAEKLAYNETRARMHGGKKF